MKTTVKTIVAGLFLTASVFGVNASENTSSTEVRIHVADYELKFESWMFEADNFSSEKNETAAGTVVDIAVSNPDFSILVEAVTKAGLAGALSAEGPFTVFAPTNDAFKALFKQLGVSGVKDLTAEQLTPILTYHVVAGKVMSTDLTNTSVATLNGQKIKIDISNGVKINESKVTAADISGKNGVIHVIDRVLIPN
ncbi:MAG TPA: fasciclin domain-containing protein [Draconibacterium sp.]|nr:fasciclin domain-containing protein [Draconibacterium sp.]